MRPASDKSSDELDLDLPALDGEDDGEVELAPEGIDGVEDDGGDALDDSTGEDQPPPDLEDMGAEGGYLVDADAVATLDVGAFDVAIEPEGKVLGDDEADHGGSMEDLISADEAFVSDGGEEGPLADDEELREEDLPALDADEDGDVPDEDLYDRAIFADSALPDLNWADRAWAKVESPAELADAPDDSGILAVPGDDPAQSTRDAVWKTLDESGKVMAATFVPGGSVVVALARGERALIVRIKPDGETSIIAEITSSNVEDDEDCRVTFLRWDASVGSLYIGGSFGVESYRPAV